MAVACASPGRGAEINNSCRCLAVTAASALAGDFVPLFCFDHLVPMFLEVLMFH